MVVITARRRQSAIISCIHHLLSLPHKTNETFPEEEEEKSFFCICLKEFFSLWWDGGRGVVGRGEGRGVYADGRREAVVARYLVPWIGGLCIMIFSHAASPH